MHIYRRFGLFKTGRENNIAFVHFALRRRYDGADLFTAVSRVRNAEVQMYKILMYERESVVKIQQIFMRGARSHDCEPAVRVVLKPYVSLRQIRVLYVVRRFYREKSLNVVPKS